MTAKKFLVIIIACVLVSSCSYPANAEGLKIGLLSQSVTEEVFKRDVASSWLRADLRDEHGNNDRFIFYDDLNSMLLALDRGEIGEINVARIVAEYIIALNPDYEISCVMKTEPVSFVFGFLKNRSSFLWYEINKTLVLMSQDGTLEKLRAKYLSNPGKDEAESVKFDSFPDAPVIKIAVTGDIPPIDYVAPDGKAAGFNAVILAEIGRRMKINIELVYINTAARNATLASGRSDGVFWYIANQFDKSEGILFSEPYYTFDEFVHIRKKN
ncbi:MAG: transporter substrate-binding domain-containing protein [Synergistaceae bacterium]|nr:transporter substrate-binding domain-containing protein [Synergistaceae bacterium]